MLRTERDSVTITVLGFNSALSTRTSALSKDQHQAEISQTCFNIGKELLQRSPTAQGQTTFTLIGIGSNNLDVSALGVFQNLVSLKTMWPHSFCG